MEEIDITGIQVENIYYVSTNNEGFRELVRYKADDWCVICKDHELEIMYPEEIEKQFQRLLVLNQSTDN